MDAVERYLAVRRRAQVMREVYRSFVEAPRRRAAFARRCSRHIADAGTAPPLFHCTAGKDRTGWAAALLLHVAGVDDATILEDYLLTNTFSSATREKYLGLVREHLGEDKVEVYERGDGGPTRTTCTTAYDAADAAYGSRRGLPARRAGAGRRRGWPGSATGCAHDRPRRRSRPARSASVVAVQAALLLAMAPFYGPHRDELYFVSAGQRLAWGYPDQPSFTPLLARLATEVAPHHLVVLRAAGACWPRWAIVLLAVQYARLLGAGRGGAGADRGRWSPRPRS